MLNLKPLMMSALKARLAEALFQVRMQKAEQSVMDRLQILSILTALPEHGSETGNSFTAPNQKS